LILKELVALTGILGLSMTSRSLRPLPPLTWITIRWLSISVTFNWANSARRSPVAYARHEQHAVERSLRRADQLRDLRLAEDQGQMQRLLGVGGIGDAPGFAQCLDEEESESRQAHDYGIGCQFALGEQLGLILAHEVQTDVHNRMTMGLRNHPNVSR
jgi:hypothetical protein